ncbi:MAG: universal stress protein [Chitinophagaceae bacterium]
MATTHILLPTDFSTSSQNAIEYGIHIARVLDIKHITVLHTYVTNNAIANQPVISAGLPELLQDEQNELNTLKEKVQSALAADVTVTALLLEGKLINIAHDLINNKGIDLIILGISSKTKLEQNLVGSNAINVMRKTNCPVIIVPEKAVWIDRPNIAAAIDITHDLDRLPIERVKNAFRQLDGNKLYLVNIDEDNNHGIHIQNPNIEKISYRFNNLNTKLEVLSASDKRQALEEYCAEKSIQLLVLFERKYGILNTIFHKSLIRQLAFGTHTPILVFEETNP